MNRPRTAFRLGGCERLMGKPRSSKNERRSVREESRAVYRRAILEAAIRVFGQTGFRDTKIADIAREAGVATGTLYNYFSSKEDIFQSILEDGRERLRAELDLQASVEDPLVRLREMVRVLFDFLEEHGLIFTIYLQLGASMVHVPAPNDEDDLFRQDVLARLQQAIVEAGDRLRRDLPAESLAMALGGLIHGAIVRWVSGGCQLSLREETDTIMDLFCNGAASS